MSLKALMYALYTNQILYNSGKISPVIRGIVKLNFQLSIFTIKILRPPPALQPHLPTFPSPRKNQPPPEEATQRRTRACGKTQARRRRRRPEEARNAALSLYLARLPSAPDHSISSLILSARANSSSPPPPSLQWRIITGIYITVGHRV